jgi:hypothetical protein
MKHHAVKKTQSTDNSKRVHLLFLLLPQIDTFLKDFSTFVIMSSKAFPAKTQAMSLPYPGLTASKLASNPQSSLPKRASELYASTPPLLAEAGDCGGEGAVATVKAFDEPNSNS